MKVKILFLHSNLDIGGAQKMRLTALKELDRNKYDVRICCLVRKGELGQEAENLGFAVDVLNHTDRLYSLGTTFKLLRYLKQHRFSIVQSSLFRANFHARIAARLSGAPVIIAEEHGEHYQFKRLKLLPYALTDKILSLFTDKIICCVEQMRRSLVQIEGIAPKKIEVIFNAIRENDLIVRRPKEEIKRELGINDGAWIIGTIGTLSKAKAQDVLLRAFSEIVKELPKLHLLIIGDGPLKEGLKKYAQELGIQDQVIFTGYRQDVADLLNAMDIFILSSKKEGLPITLLEAMYMGIPCIVPPIGGIPEIIENGKDGYLFSFPDPKDLAAKILQILNNAESAKAVSQAAQDKVREQFLSTHYVNRLEQLHQQLLMQKKLD